MLLNIKTVPSPWGEGRQRRCVSAQTSGFFAVMRALKMRGMPG